MFAHSFDFDPTGGFGLADLLRVTPPRPRPDFADFWRERYARCLMRQPHAALASTALVLPGRRVQLCRYRSSAEMDQAVEIQAWLVTPEQGPVERALIIGHGYAGRDRPDSEHRLDRCAVFYPCCRGLGANRVKGIASNPLFHVLHKIRDKRHYVIGGCVDDLWLAVSVILDLFPQVAGRIAYLGTSFGGGIGALATAWDERIVRLGLEVPTFGHQALRLSLPCVGSGEAVRIHQRHHNWDVLETLDYYDAAVAASFIRVPTLVAAAGFDPAVPPAGQFAIYNALAPALRQLLVLDAGHFSYPDQALQQAQLAEQIEQFLATL